MADKKLNEVSTLTDFDYALVVKGNDVAKVTKQQLATILGGLMNNLKLFPFMPQRKLTTDEEVNSAIESGMYHVTGENGISVVLNYSIMIVFNDRQGYVIQMAFRLGVDAAGFRRYFNGEWGDFRTFVLDS